MTDTGAPEAAANVHGKPVRLDFRSGGWALALGLAVCGGVVAWSFLGASRRAAARPRVAFDLSTCLVTSAQLVVGTTPDALPPLDDPTFLGPDEAKRYRLPERGKLLVDPDRVVGVAIGGEARAYPLRILAWHEVVCDVVGGVPICVTYGSLTDSVRVFDRRVAGGAARRFAASGMLWNSNLLLYDHPEAPAAGGPEAAPSLWSQLQGRAVTGPAAAAGLRLTPLRAQLVPWSEWRALHPDSRVLAPVAGREKLYKRDPYHSYVGSDILRFPVDPLPPLTAAPGGGPPLPRKAPCVIVGRPGARRVVPLALIAQRTDAARAWRTTIDGAPVTFRYHAGEPPTVTVDVEGDLEVVHASWFGWFAAHPDEATFIE